MQCSPCPPAVFSPVALRRLGLASHPLFASPDSAAADLAGLAAAQTARVGPLADRLRKAREWLGGRFDWTPQLAWELDQFLRSLTPNDKRSRLSGSSIDAAFADHRWKA